MKGLHVSLHTQSNKQVGECMAQFLYEHIQEHHMLGIWHFLQTLFWNATHDSIMPIVRPISLSIDFPSLQIFASFLHSHEWSSDYTVGCVLILKKIKLLSGTVCSWILRSSLLGGRGISERCVIKGKREWSHPFTHFFHMNVQFYFRRIPLPSIKILYTPSLCSCFTRPTTSTTLPLGLFWFLPDPHPQRRAGSPLSIRSKKYVLLNNSDITNINNLSSLRLMPLKFCSLQT